MAIRGGQKMFPKIMGWGEGLVGTGKMQEE